MSQGTITESDRKFVETWANVAVMINAIIRLDSRGQERQEVIQGKRNFFITTEERLITQDRIVDKKHDPFSNGCFRPVLVPDSVTVHSNPNALSEDEMRSVLASSDLAWDEWLGAIDSPETLRRMIDIADSVPTFTLSRYKQLGQRIAEVKPVTRIVQKDQAQFDALAAGGASGGQGPTGAPAQRGQGGRSRDYRPE